MYISELYLPGKTVISFEVFPPKKDDGAEAMMDAIGELSSLNPDFISVTCGAGGSGDSDRTCQIADTIKNLYNTETLAHLTCVSADKARIRMTVQELRDKGVENILALRGDIPGGREDINSDYRYAADLIGDLKSLGGFCVGAAAYPEGHIECDSESENIMRLKEKQDRGADFLITQLFFDNAIFYRFIDKAMASGITIPISVGIMPILSRRQIERMIFMCGASLPSGIIRLLHKYENSPRDLKKAGIDYAVGQMCGLVENGARGVHIYTMNRPEIAARAVAELRA